MNKERGRRRKVYFDNAKYEVGNQKKLPQIKSRYKQPCDELRTTTSSYSAVSHSMLQATFSLTKNQTIKLLLKVAHPGIKYQYTLRRLPIHGLCWPRSRSWGCNATIHCMLE